MFAYNTLTNAAREGARTAIVNQYKPSIIARAKQQTADRRAQRPERLGQLLPGERGRDAEHIDPVRASQIAVGCLAIVSFEATYQPITPLIGNIVFKNGVTFTASSGPFGRVQLPREPE